MRRSPHRGEDRVGNDRSWRRPQNSGSAPENRRNRNGDSASVSRALALRPRLAQLQIGRGNRRRHLVFGNWKGRNTVRQLVTPSNPQTAGKTTARKRTRVTGAMQNWVNTTTMKAPMPDPDRQGTHQGRHSGRAGLDWLPDRLDHRRGWPVLRRRAVRLCRAGSGRKSRMGSRSRWLYPEDQRRLPGGPGRRPRYAHLRG